MRCCTLPPSWSPLGAPPLAALRPTPDLDRFPPVGRCILRLLLRIAHALLYLATLVVPTWRPIPRGSSANTGSGQIPAGRKMHIEALVVHALLYLATLVVPTWRPTPHGSSANTRSGQIPAVRSYCACSVVPGHPRGAPPLATLRPTPDPDRFPPVGHIAHAPLYLATLAVPAWRFSPRSSEL